MKKLPLISVAVLAFTLSGCSTMFTGVDQPVEVRTQNEEVGTRLDNVAKFTVIGDAYRVKYENIEAGEQVTLHRKNTPIVVKVEESQCILPSEEHFQAGIHPAVLLDVLATSPLSTSIDSSTGAAWKYDTTLNVTPKIKDTPQCRRWLEKKVAKMQEEKLSKVTEKQQQLNRGGYAYDAKSVVHPRGYEDQFKKDEKEVKEQK